MTDDEKGTHVLRTPGGEQSDRLTALCCQCGRVRTVSKRYNGPRSRYAAWETGAEWAQRRMLELQRQGLYVEHQPGWRCLLELKCETCKVRTAHAFIREDQYRDTAEREDRKVDKARRRVARRLAGLEGDGAQLNLPSSAH